MLVIGSYITSEILRAFSSWRLVFYGLAVIFIMISDGNGGYELTPSSMKRLYRNIARNEAKRFIVREVIIIWAYWSAWTYKDFGDLPQ